MLGSTPSNLIPFIDFYRVAELLCDGDQVPVTNETELDALPRAIQLVSAAESILTMAAKARGIYLLGAQSK